MRSLMLLPVLCLSATAVDFSFGVRAGARVTGAFDSSFRFGDESRRYLVGPSLSVELPRRFAAEANVLYSHAGLANDGCQFTYCTASRTRGNVWTVPLLLRFHLTSGAVKPYLTGGYSLRVVPEASTDAEAWRSGPIFPDEQVDYAIRRYTYPEPGRTSHGVTAGGGLSIPFGPFRLLPEVRYTRWNSRYWEESGSRGAYRASQKNQVDVLFGIYF